MTIANDLIFQALRFAGVNGVGQTPSAEDASDAFRLLDQIIGVWNLQRNVQVNPTALPVFTDRVTDVPFWTPYEGVLLANLARALRMAYAMPPDPEIDQSAATSLQLFQALNQQQVAPLHAGPVTTCLQVIFLALRMAGRLTDQQSVSGTSKDVDDAFCLLVALLAGWQQDPGLAWVLKDYSVTSTGAVSYQLPDRPRRIASAFARLLAPVPPPSGQMDYPLAIIGSREVYNEISLKNMITFPAGIWLEQIYPLPSIYVWPIPAAGQFAIHVSYQSPLPTWTAPGDALGLPTEYVSPLIYSLASQIIELDGRVPPPTLLARARGALAGIRAANMQMAPLEIEGFPAPGGPGSGGISGAVAPFQSVVVVGQTVLG